MGIYLQASCIISLIFSIIISIIWWYTEPLLLLLHQTPTISKQAASYLRCLIPGIFAYGILQNILRFLQTQSVVFPLVVCSVAPLVLHLGLNYVLVYCTSLGYLGPPLAASITFWVSALMLFVYVKCDKKFEHTWKGLTMESFHYVIPNLKLALPSAAMVCLEYWAFEILVLLAGLMPNSETTTSLIATCVNTEAIAYNFTYGLSAAARGESRMWLAAVDFLYQFWNILFHRHAHGGSARIQVSYGLWIGLICGLAAQSATLFLVTKLQNWATIELSSEKENSILV
ncbi:hypothetical protein KSS87_002235 [Heliosperma pusillum]|nr:hypothetical protein KSS87_002235 [Heliosperma pusillum]